MVQGRAGSGSVVPLMVRVPEELRDRIKAAAEANGRSQNSEIVATLEEKYPAPHHRERIFEAALVDLFIGDGWRVWEVSRPAPYDFLLEKGSYKVAVEIKSKAKDVTVEQVKQLAGRGPSDHFHDAYIVALGSFDPKVQEAAKKAKVTLFDIRSDEELLAQLDANTGS